MNGTERDVRTAARARKCWMGLLLVGTLLCVPAARSATFNVTKTADTADGTCDADCSLREAILAAHAAAGADTVAVPAGTYLLSIDTEPGLDDSIGQEDDLDLTSDMTIVGAGRELTFIDGAGSFRIFDVVQNVSVEIQSLTMQNGHATQVTGYPNGGCLINWGSTIALADVAVSGCAADGSGGGLYVSPAGGTLNLRNATIDRNTASSVGGGIYLWTGTLRMSESTLAGNSDPDSAAALYMGTPGLVELTNVTIADNPCTDTGQSTPPAAVVLFSGATLTNVTIADNDDCVGIRAHAAYTLRNSLLSGGTVNCHSTMPTSGGHNLSGDTSCSLSGTGDLQGLAPLLGPLQDNGGLTETVALLDGSPAIDAGDAALCPALDQRGAIRPFDGDGTDGAVCDIGAFELGASIPTAGVLQFGLASFSRDEDSATAAIAVQRTGDTQGAVGVSYSTVPGTASVGVDYTAASGTLSWSNGDGAEKIISIPLLDDQLVECGETVTVQLGSPTGGAALGAVSQTVLDIVDDEVSAAGAVSIDLGQGFSSVEEGNQAQIVLVRRAGSSGQITVQTQTQDDTATAGADYTAESIVHTWSEGQTGALHFNVNTTNDSLVESTETLLVNLGSTTGGAVICGPAQATISITDNDVAVPGVLQFTAVAYQVAEAGPSASVTVSRTGGDGPVSVQYATSNGTAGAGTDYTAASGTLNWADGDISNKTFTVSILQDEQDEADETILLGLSSPTGGATLGTRDEATLTIVDDEEGGGILQFASAQFTVVEGSSGASTSALVSVQRAGSSVGQISVDYATSNGTASAGTDYTAVSGTLTWADGDNAVKTFTVPVLDNGQSDGGRTVNLGLSNPTGGAGLGNPAAASLLIEDDEVTGALQFSAAAYSSTEDGGSAIVTVVRTGGSDGQVSVQYATGGGTAVAGVDYTAVSGTLTWSDGDSADKTFTVPILDNGQVDGQRTVGLSLSSPGGGASLGSPVEATLSILDDDRQVPALPAGWAWAVLALAVAALVRRRPRAVRG